MRPPITTIPTVGPHGFRPLTGTPIYRLIITSEGEPKSGKNHFAFTAPGPIGLHQFERGTEGMLHKFIQGVPARGDNPAILPVKIDAAEYLVTVKDGMGIQEVSDLTNPVWGAFQANYAIGLAKYRTSIVDTASDAWEMVRMAHFGKLTQVMPHHYGPVNTAFKNLYARAFSSPGNLIMIHRSKDEYTPPKMVAGKEVSNKTGARVLAGFKDTKYESQVHLRHFRDTDGFHTEIVTCRQNPEIEGFVLSGEMNTFTGLGLMVYPDSTEGNWK